MTPERYARVCELFDAAVALPAAERAALLDRECAADAGLRAEVERMLAGDAGGRTPTFLAAPLAVNLKRLLPAAATAHEPGHARLLRREGHSGRWWPRRLAVAVLVSVAALGAGLLVAGLLLSNHQLWQQQAQTEEALNREREAHAELKKALLRAERAPYFERVKVAWQECGDNQVRQAEKWLSLCPVEQRGWEWHYVRRLCHPELCGPREHIDHTEEVLAVCFSSGGRLATAGDDGSIQVWGAAARRRVMWNLDGHTGAVTAVSFARDGTLLASAGADGTVRLWAPAMGPGPPTLTMHGHKGAVAQAALSRDGRMLASAGADHTVRVWDAQTGACVRTLRGHTGPVHAVGFSPDGTRIVSAGEDRTVRVWDISGAAVLVLKGHGCPVRGVCFSPDGKQLASGGGVPGGAGEIKVWDVQTGREEWGIQGKDVGMVRGVCYHPDGSRLASCGTSLNQSGVVQLWDAKTGLEAITLAGHTGLVHAVCFSPDGNRLASAGQDRTVRLWDATPLEQPAP
jgi:hypothetical protein